MATPELADHVVGRVADLVGRLIAGRGAGGRTPARPMVVGIDGRSGAGKTVLAAAVTARLERDTAVSAVSLESMYRGWHGLAAGTRLWSEQILPALATGRTVEYDAWDWHAGRAGRPVRLRPGGVVLA
ncbi:MAG: hypothetical protein ACFCUP_13985, partial [Actinomycetales bacterium]